MTENYWQELTVTGSPHGSITVPIPHTFGCTHATIVFQRPMDGAVTLTFEDQIPCINGVPLAQLDEAFGHKVYYQYGPTIVGSTTPPMSPDKQQAPMTPMKPNAFKVRMHASPVRAPRIERRVNYKKDWFEYPLLQCCQCDGLANYGPVCGHPSSLLCIQCYITSLRPICVKCEVCKQPAMVFDRQSLLDAKFAEKY